MPMLTADVPEELIEQLDQVAAEQSKKVAMTVSRSAVIRQALREYLTRFFLTDCPDNGTNVTNERAAA